VQIARLEQQLQDRESQLAEAKAKYHRAAAEGADITDALTRFRQDSQQLRYVVEAARMRSPGACLRHQGIACTWHLKESIVVAPYSALCCFGLGVHAMMLLCACRARMQQAEAEAQKSRQESQQLKSSLEAERAMHGQTQEQLKTTRCGGHQGKSAENNMCIHYLESQVSDVHCKHISAFSYPHMLLRSFCL
jgi:hypothetical protein